MVNIPVPVSAKLIKEVDDMTSIISGFGTVFVLIASLSGVASVSLVWNDRSLGDQNRSGLKKHCRLNIRLR